MNGYYTSSSLTFTDNVFTNEPRTDTMDIYTEKFIEYHFATEEILFNDTVVINTPNKMLRIYLHLITVAFSCVVIIMSVITNVKLISQKRTARLRYFIHTSLCTSNLIVGIVSIITPLFKILHYQFPDTSLFKILSLPQQRQQEVVKWLSRLSRIIPMFSLISSLLHVILLIIASFIFLRISDGYRWRVKPCVMVLSLFFTWMISIFPFSFPFFKHVFDYSIQAVFSFLCFMNFIFLLCIVYLIKVYRGTDNKNEREQFLFSRILAQKKKQRLRKKVVSLILGFIFSTFVSSYPYMIYYLTRIAGCNVNIDKDLVDELLMLTILMKCVCDGTMYVFIKGCKRKRAKQTYSITFTHSSLSMSTRLSSENTLI